MPAWRRIAAIGLALACASAVGAQGAAARSFATIADDDGAGSPLLLGDAVAWTGFNGDPILHGDDGSGQREIARLPPEATYVDDHTNGRSVDGSADLIVVDALHRCYSEACEDVAVIVSETYMSVFVGRLGAPLACIGGVRPPSACSEDPQPTGVASVSGQTVAWPVSVAVASPAGTRSMDETFVRDFAAGAPAPDRATVAVGAGVGDGDWVAGLVAPGGTDRPTEIDVVDWRTQSTVLRITGLSSPRVLSVEPDGTVVYATSASRDRHAVFAASASRPQPRRVVPATQGSVLSAGGRVLRATYANTMTVAGVARGAPATFKVFDLEGNVVGRVDEPAALGVDIDGQRLAFASRPCSVTRMVLQQLGEPAVRRPEGRCPAARLARGATRDGDSVRVRATCARTARLGCLGHARLLGTVRRGRRPRTVILASGGVSLQTGERGSVDLTLARRGRRYLRSHRAAALRLLSVGSLPPGSHVRPLTRRRRVHLASAR